MWNGERGLAPSCELKRAARAEVLSRLGPRDRRRTTPVVVFGSERYAGRDVRKDSYRGRGPDYSATRPRSWRIGALGIVWILLLPVRWFVRLSTVGA